MKPALLGFVFGIFIALEFAYAALPQLDPAQFPEPVILSVEEVLSMPAANRVGVALLRKNQMIAPLNKIAFTEKADFQVRWSALVLLAQIQGPLAEMTLDRALEHKEWFLRNAALLTYPTLFPNKAAKVALKMLEDKALVIRSAAIEVLEVRMDPEVREALWTELDHPRNFRKKQSLWIRPQILQVLAVNPGNRETLLFLNHLRDPDLKLHPFAIQGLERITGQTLGKTDQSLTDKRDLWLKWARNTRAEMALQ